MRHNFIVEGRGFRLRPVTEDDAPFILQLRTDPRLNMFIHATSPSLDSQLQWIRTYYERPGDYYFIIESMSDHTAQGTIGVYSIGPEADSAEWGRWVIRSGSLAAIESAWLIYRVAFDLLHLPMVYSRTMVKNEKVLAFHDASGCQRHAVPPRSVHVNGCDEVVVEHRVMKEEWPRMAQVLERRINRLNGTLIREYSGEKI